MQRLKLSIYLIKEEYLDYEDIIASNKKDGLTSFEISPSLEISGKGFIGESKKNPPEWDDFLNNLLINYENQLNQSTRAVLFVKRKSRIFAFAFGYGKHLMKDEAIVRNFGLKILLNNAKR